MPRKTDQQTVECRKALAWRKLVESLDDSERDLILTDLYELGSIYDPMPLKDSGPQEFEKGRRFVVIKILERLTYPKDPIAAMRRIAAHRKRFEGQADDPTILIDE